MKKFIVYAHRGASFYAPENTLAAFNKAISLNTPGIELDLRLTKDRKVVVFHDEFIDKKSNSIGKIKSYKYKDLLKFDFGSWFSKDFINEKILLFEEFAHNFLVKDLYYSIELKEPKLERKTLKIINKYAKYKNKIQISSFDYKILKKIRRLDKNINISWLIKDDINEKNIKKLKKIKGSELAVPFDKVSKEGIKLAQKNNIEIRLWRINNIELISKVIDLDVNSITVDFPDKF